MHPSVVACCMEDLLDVGKNHHVARMSQLKEKTHQERAFILDCVIYRFFMIAREVQMVPFGMRLD